MGTSVGGVAIVGCSSMGEVLHGGVSGGDRGVFQNKVVGSGWDTFELWWAVVQGDLTGREEVSSTSALLLDDLSLQVLHDAAMLPMEQLSLKDPMGLILTDGFGTGDLSFLDHMASGCLGFPDCH